MCGYAGWANDKHSKINLIKAKRVIRFRARREDWTVKGMTAGREKLCYLALWACLLLY